jgi:hypothetical protein
MLDERIIGSKGQIHGVKIVISPERNANAKRRTMDLIITN